MWLLKNDSSRNRSTISVQIIYCAHGKQSVKVTVGATKFNKEIKLPRRDFAMVPSLIQFEVNKFHFVPTQMMIADCLTKAFSAKELLGVLENGKTDLTSD